MTITFRQETDTQGTTRVFVVGGWPDEALAAPEFLAAASPEYISISIEGPSSPPSGNRLRIKVANGEALYEMAPHRIGEPYIRLCKISSSLEPGT